MNTSETMDKLSRKLNDSIRFKKQFNPHFINNTLNAIQNLILIDEKDSALKYISLLGKYFTIITEQSNKSEITIGDELEFLKIYIALQELRFNNQMSINLKADESVFSHQKEKKLPPFVLKLLLENAIEHGVFHGKDIGEININFQIENDQLIITIEDNGIGINKSKEINSWKKIEMQQSSISLIEELLFINFEIKDIPSREGVSLGTKVILKI